MRKPRTKGMRESSNSEKCLRRCFRRIAYTERFKYFPDEVEPGSGKNGAENASSNTPEICPASPPLHVPSLSWPGCGHLISHCFLHKIFKTPPSQTKKKKKRASGGGPRERGGEATPSHLCSVLSGEAAAAPHNHRRPCVHLPSRPPPRTGPPTRDRLGETLPPSPTLVHRKARLRGKEQLQEPRG